MRRALTAAVALLVLPVLPVPLAGLHDVAASGVRGAAQGPVSAAAAQVAGPERREVQVGGVRRPYLLVRPAGTPRGAVLVAHAQNQTMGQAHARYGLGFLPERGQLVAYLGGHRGSWNAGTCCGAAHRTGLDDVGYVAAVLADVRTLLPAGRPTALMGVSVGGMLAWTAVCTRRVDVTLVLSVSGTRASSCASPRLPRRFLELHGARDTTIPLDPPSRRSPLLGTVPLATRPAVRLLTDSCTRTVPHGAARTDWGGCAGGGVVRLLVRPVGHVYGDLGAPFVLARALEEVGAVP